MASGKDLAVGHDVIDAEHRGMMQRVAELRARVEAGDAPGAAAALAGLWGATVGHFASEEALMEQFAYPERRAHGGAHQLFLGDLKALMGELAEDGLTEDVAAWARQRVPEWITFHIETNDAPLARFVARRLAQRATATSRGPAPGRRDA
jgi:hemerythrin-like metal-binding protein